MSDSKEYIKILSDNKATIQTDFEVTALKIFGSVARGDNGPESDIDILVDMPPKIFLLSSLKGYLEEILCTSVDLVRQHSHLSQSFINQVTKDAITIF